VRSGPLALVLESLYAAGINDLGQIVGFYTNSRGLNHGFLATPTPEPSTVLLLALGTLGLIAWGLCHQRMAA
jgi:probable HAF family extracellular repeat protein